MGYRVECLRSHRSLLQPLLAFIAIAIVNFIVTSSLPSPLTVQAALPGKMIRPTNLPSKEDDAVYPATEENNRQGPETPDRWYMCTHATITQSW
jgi:hypothetical protein